MKKIFLTFIVIIATFATAYAVELSTISKEAIQDNKLILLSVERDNCAYCEKMNREVFAPKSNAKKINQHYIQKIVMIQKEELPENIKVKYYPTNFILNPKDMKIVDEFAGYIKADDFIELLDLVYQEEVQN